MAAQVDKLQSYKYIQMSCCNLDKKDAFKSFRKGSKDTVVMVTAVLKLSVFTPGKVSEKWVLFALFKV